MNSPDIKFWDSRYRSGKTPWDFGGVPAAVTAWLSTARAGRVLIPGCGSGYEVRAFAERAWDVVAVDCSPVAVKRARRLAADRVLLADFFTHDFGGRTFDIIYERTFLCSLPPEARPQYIRRIAELLVPGGKLFGFFLYGHEDDPPPYPLTAGDAQALFGGHFVRVADEPVTDSLPLFAGRERWQVWQRKSEAHRP